MGKAKPGSPARQRYASDRPAKPWSLFLFGGACLALALALAARAFLQQYAGSSAEWERLVKWMRANGAVVHKGLRTANRAHGGHNVRSLVTDTALIDGTVLLRVPKKLWFNEHKMFKASALQHIPACVGEDHREILCSAGLALEMKKDDMSFYAPMIQMYPSWNDFRMFHPMLAEPPVVHDFGELPIVRRLLAGHMADMDSMGRCFKAWKLEKKSPVANLTLEEFIAGRFQFKTRTLGSWTSAALIPILDLANTASLDADINIAHHEVQSHGSSTIEVRAKGSIAAGSEIFNLYCEDCDNEMMLSGWGVYLEDNTHSLNDLEPVNCSAVSPANEDATATSLQEATMQVLDTVAIDVAGVGWTAPRCRSVSSLAPGQQLIRCSLARLSWELCASAWGLTRAHASKRAGASPSARREHTRIHTNLGLALAQRGDLMGAADSFRTALRIYPSYAMVHSNLGHTLKKLGDLEGSEKSYRAAREIDRADKEVRKNLKEVVSLQGKEYR